MKNKKTLSIPAIKPKVNVRIVYIAHPIRAKTRGEVLANIESVRNLVVLHSSARVHAIAPYLQTLTFLHDDKPGDTEIGFSWNFQYFKRKFIDAVWVFGGLSAGVQQEIAWAQEFGIPVSYFITEPKDAA